MKYPVMMISAAIAAMTAVTAYADDIKVTVNGENVEFDQPPVIENDRTLVPMRAIFEALGATVEWDNETRTVTSTKDETVIKLTIDSNEMAVGDKTVELDVSAKIISDRTMVPVRAISEAMDCKVEWIGESATVVITSGNEATPTPEPTSTPVPVDIEDNVNIFDPAWIVEKTEINNATGEAWKSGNEKLCATDFVTINANKSYYAAYYDPNACAYKSGHCYNFAFYDADKSYISGGTTDMSKIIKAPENASYIRFTIKLRAEERGIRYLTFMQTETAPKEFVKSNKVMALAQTELFNGKKIVLVGDAQVNNASVWTKHADERLGAKVFSVKGFNLLTFTTALSSSLSNDKTVNTFPTDADYMIISAGYCDWIYSYDIGGEYSSNGGIYDFLENAKIKWPNTKLVMLTIPTAKNADGIFTGGGIYNKRGMNSKDYSALIVEACEKTGTECIDISQLWEEENMSEYMKENSLSYLYPNEKGGELIAETVVSRMIEIASK